MNKFPEHIQKLLGLTEVESRIHQLVTVPGPSEAWIGLGGTPTIVYDKALDTVHDRGIREAGTP